MTDLNNDHDDEIRYHHSDIGVLTEKYRAAATQLLDEASSLEVFGKHRFDVHQWTVEDTATSYRLGRLTHDAEDMVQQIDLITTVDFPDGQQSVTCHTSTNNHGGVTTQYIEETREQEQEHADNFAAAEADGRAVHQDNGIKFYISSYNPEPEIEIGLQLLTYIIQDELERLR